MLNVRFDEVASTANYNRNEERGYNFTNVIERSMCSLAITGRAAIILPRDDKVKKNKNYRKLSKWVFRREGK